MEGLFRSASKYDTDLYWGSVWERDAEFLHWREVQMERDIGPFKNGEVISHASYNQATHEISLSKQDEEGNEIDWFKFKVDVSYTPLPLARTD